jgi:hypothetical protein
LKNDFSRETAGPRCRAAIKISRVIWRGERPRKPKFGSAPTCHRLRRISAVAEKSPETGERLKAPKVALCIIGQECN